MEIIIGLGLAILGAIILMIFMTMFYRLLYAVMPLLVFIVLAVGIILGLWKTIRNTFDAIKEVYKGGK